MTQTVAWEIIIKAAEMLEKSIPGAYIHVAKGEGGKVVAALKKTKPKIERMRKRLDEGRERRKHQPKHAPKWAREL
jgi:hypothetical protein